MTAPRSSPFAITSRHELRSANVRARPRARGASEERGTPAPRLRASARVPRQQPRNSKQSVLVTCTIIYCIFTGVMLMISKAH